MTSRSMYGLQSPLGHMIVMWLILSGSLVTGQTASERRRLAGGAVIRVGADGRPEVVAFKESGQPADAERTGLYVWHESGRERWAVLSHPENSRSDTPSDVSNISAAPSRSEDAVWYDTNTDAAVFTTVQLAQLRGLSRMRGGWLITPAADAMLLNPKITVRRRAVVGASPYPATELLLNRRRETLLRIPFGEGRARIEWSEIPDIPESLRMGLPAGTYILSTRDATEEVRFTVADSGTRSQSMRHTDRLASVVGGATDPVYLLAAVQQLLNQTDQDGRPQPYLTDALDILESAPDALLGSYLKQTREQILSQLSGRLIEPTTDTELPTGIASIDRARNLISQARWDQAQQVLRSIHDPSTREEGLTLLYQAVISSESGRATEGEADALFRRAIHHLEHAEPQDRIRAHTNYGNHLLARCQDRLYNHSFQIASGVGLSLTGALFDWRDAALQYASALRIAREVIPLEQPPIEVNLARLYGLLGDFIRTLTDSPAGEQQFPAGLEAADAAVRQLTQKALHSDDQLTAAIASQTLAELAVRQHEWEAAKRYAQTALQLFLDCGSLAGVEGIQRLTGLGHLEQIGATDDAAAASTESRQAALQCLRTSEVLSEILREQIPVDHAGRSRAGYFARRAYVNERIVELLIGETEYAEALQFAELAKARTLQDVLAAGAVSTPSQALPISLPQLISAWPGDVAAVEYFLGSERSWIFLITTSGKVTAFPVADSSGRPIASRDLILHVRQFLAAQFPTPPRSQAKMMELRLRSGQGVDHTWQVDFHAFCSLLFPDAVLSELRRARTVLIVPHHILHYFPFAAIVTEPDRKARSTTEMVEPRFLLDEPFDLCYAPSLSAWNLLRQRPSRPLTDVHVLGIADFGPGSSLPGVTKDLDNVQAVFGDSIRTLASDDTATETAAKQILAQSGLVFVGTHGSNMADQPLNSCLRFRADPSNDGRLTAGELFATSSSADLVVLSACYSGLADRAPLPGDDLFGIERALLYSGSRTVVSGQWDVFDGTAPDLMREFFIGLKNGQAAPAALASSQRKLLSKERELSGLKFFLHPYFWSVFKVSGDDRTAFRPEIPTRSDRDKQ